MKSLAFIPIAGALFLYGSAFFGVWTAPGLETLPTLDAVLQSGPWSKAEKPKPKTGVFAISEDQDYLPEGVAPPNPNSQFITLTAFANAVSREKATVDPPRKMVDRSKLPPRWYTLNPPPPKPKPVDRYANDPYAKGRYHERASSARSRRR